MFSLFVNVLYFSLHLNFFWLSDIGLMPMCVSGGFAELYNQFGSYQRWCRATSSRAQFYERSLDMVNLIDDPESPPTFGEICLQVLDHMKNFLFQLTATILGQSNLRRDYDTAAQTK